MNSWPNRKQARDQQKRRPWPPRGPAAVRAAGGRRGRNNAEQALLDQKLEPAPHGRVAQPRDAGEKQREDVRRLAAAHGDDEPAAAPRADDGAAAAGRIADAVDRRESHGAAHGRLADAERAGPHAELPAERAAARRALARLVGGGTMPRAAGSGFARSADGEPVG